MSNMREAAQQALEVLEKWRDGEFPEVATLHMISAMREAIAQPDDKAQPVAVQHLYAKDGGAVLSFLMGHTVSAYAAPQPPAEQGAELSDAQIRAMWIIRHGYTIRQSEIASIRDIIAADRAARGSAA